jgi:tripartite-type tricarboxylate transporter receptor subunit TctC
MIRPRIWTLFTGVAAYFLAVVVNPALAVQTLPELREYAKANPGTVSYGHAGVGSIQHLTGELLKSQTECTKWCRCRIEAPDRSSPML